MTPRRTFTAHDISTLVEALRHSPDISPEKFSGMEFIANACAQLERMSDTDIESVVKRLYRSA
jgi:hypothetical protein